MNKLMVLLLTLTLFGCAPTMYAHKTKGPDVFPRDDYDCKMDARQTVANMGFANNLFMTNQEYHKCLKFKHGWYPVQK